MHDSIRVPQFRASPHIALTSKGKEGAHFKVLNLHYSLTVSL